MTLFLDRTSASLTIPLDQFAAQRVCSPLRLLALACLASLLAAASARASFIPLYNVITTGDFVSTSDVEGKAYIGGNLTGSNSFGVHLQPAANYAGVNTLIVVGNVQASNANLNAGNLLYGGSYDTATYRVNLNGPGATATRDTTLTNSAIARELSSTSAAFAGLGSTGTDPTAPSGQPAGVIFNATPVNGLAIFNIPGSLLNNACVQSFDLHANGASSILINVSGTGTITVDKNFLGGWNTSVASTTLWNFNQASEVDLDTHFFGAVLAPSAKFTNTTATEGSAFAQSIAAQGEIHLPDYAGYLPLAATPEPSAFVLCTVAGLCCVLYRRLFRARFSTRRAGP